MFKRLVVPLVFGFLGVGILVSLGVWQMKRLTWKEGILTNIETRLSQTPIDIPLSLNQEKNNYQRVKLSGRMIGKEVHILTSIKGVGPGYRVIVPFQMADRLIMVDRGFITVNQKNTTRVEIGKIDVIGNLLWPDDYDESFTPEPDLPKNIWFARELDRLARHLQTKPILVVLSEANIDDKPLEGSHLLPVTAHIPNNHKEYAITWFLLALVWLGMTGYYFSRIRRKTNSK